MHSTCTKFGVNILMQSVTFAMYPYTSHFIYTYDSRDLEKKIVQLLAMEKKIDQLLAMEKKIDQLLAMEKKIDQLLAMETHGMDY